MRKLTLVFFFMQDMHHRMDIRVILIKSSDTDVEILACYYADKISSELYLHLGTQAKARLINISTLTAHLGPPVCNALLGLHALTGCDMVSAFAGKAKKKALGTHTE